MTTPSNTALRSRAARASDSNASTGSHRSEYSPCFPNRLSSESRREWNVAVVADALEAARAASSAGAAVRRPHFGFAVLALARPKPLQCSTSRRAFSSFAMRSWSARSAPTLANSSASSTLAFSRRVHSARADGLSRSMPHVEDRAVTPATS